MPWVFYAQARRYDAWNGRFVSKDSDKFIKITRPESFNQYMYCDNNPEKYLDPSGNIYIIISVTGDETIEQDYSYEEQEFMMGGCKRLTIGENGDYPSFQGAWDAMCKEFDVVEGVVIHTHGGKDGLYDTQEATTPILEKGDFGLMCTITGGQK